MEIRPFTCHNIAALPPGTVCKKHQVLSNMTSRSHHPLSTSLNSTLLSCLFAPGKAGLNMNMNCPHSLSAFAAVVFMKYVGLSCLPSFGHMKPCSRFTPCCSVQPPGLLGNLACHICKAVERNTVNIMLTGNLFLKLSHESSICEFQCHFPFLKTNK